MDKFRTVMGLFVGSLLGVVNGLGFQSITVGLIDAVCFSTLFTIIFNKHLKKK